MEEALSLKVSSGVLSTALSRAEKIVETRNTLPILSMVRLSAEKGKLEITTTNLDIEYRQTIDVSGDLEPCCVDAKRLSAMAAAAKGDMSMTLDGAILTVKAGRSRWAMPSLPADDFPNMPVDKLGKSVPLDIEAINRALWAVSKEETRFYLNGIFMNDDAGSTRYVATDGHKLACITSKCKWPKGAPDVIVPTALAKLASSIGGGDASWDSRKMQIVNGDMIITGKMIEGSFPDYRRVIPAVSTVTQIDAQDMIAAIKCVNPASDALMRRLRLIPGDNELAIKIEGTAGNEGEDAIDAHGDRDFETGVNSDYLSGVLTACGEGSVRISQENANSPMRFDPVNDTSFIGVVMPMRI